MPESITDGYARIMTIKFTKMHGLGNDFMVIDAINQSIDIATELPAERIKNLADRHFGIGFDQLLLVEKPAMAEAAFRYRIFNADGGEVEQCGNGARCFAVFVRDQGLTALHRIPVETAGGLIVLQLEDNGEVTVDMGEPDFSPASLPFVDDKGQPQKQALEYNLQLNGENYAIGVVSMGNPHVVMQVASIDTYDVAGIGASIGADRHFPKGVNVGFMEIVNRKLLHLRVYERGAGETMACGTGACAAVAVGIQANLLDNEVQTQLRGGVLTIRWAGKGSPLMMTGPATSVFQGQI